MYGSSTVSSDAPLVATVTVQSTTQPIGPNAPTILSVSQALSGGAALLVLGVAQNAVTGYRPIATLKLYRGSTATGPWVLADTEALSAFVVINQVFDRAPTFGVTSYYAATAVDTSGAESAISNVVSYTASLVALGLVPGTISPAARGPYPVLGCDVYLDPNTCEAVIGPNGDLLTVNGLLCLAQDLRIRILTELGELRLHSDFGLFKGKVIGSGQAKPQVQAQIFRADIIDMLNAEPRVYKVIDVSVGQYDAYSWLIKYSIMAVSVEDVQHFNLVYPYYGPAAVSA